MLMPPRYILYIHYDRDDLSPKAAIHQLQQCVASVYVWMDNSALRLTD